MLEEVYCVLDISLKCHQLSSGHTKTVQAIINCFVVMRENPSYWHEVLQTFSSNVHYRIIYGSLLNSKSWIYLRVKTPSYSIKKKVLSSFSWTKGNRWRTYRFIDFTGIVNLFLSSVVALEGKLLSCKCQPTNEPVSQPVGCPSPPSSKYDYLLPTHVFSTISAQQQQQQQQRPHKM
ncbi:hypothetical protein GQX74_005128 [Glossina fuscipes]|nr:hypothetical protein GQX74_005128 [Glossina fuscipes]